MNTDTVRYRDRTGNVEADGTFISVFVDRPIEIGRCYGMDMILESKIVIISRQPSALQVLIDQKQPENVEYLQIVR